MKIKFNSDDTLPLNKLLKLHMLTVIVRSVFKKDGKYYSRFFRWPFLWVIKTLQFEWIDVLEEIDINKSNESKECMLCHYWYFKDISYKFVPHVCGCHDMLIMVYEIKNIAMLNVKGVDYRRVLWGETKNDATSMLCNYKLDDIMHIMNILMQRKHLLK